MPNLGAGVDQHVNTAPVPTWVYQPPTFISGSPAPPAIRLYNEGTQLLYVGGANVSPFNGLPLPPGGRPLEISNAQFGTIYTCSNVLAGAVGGTVTAASTAGQNSFVAAASVSTTSFAVGSTLVIGRAGSQEVLVIQTISTSYTTIGTTTVALYDHAATSPLFPATTTPGQLRATAGIA